MQQGLGVNVNVVKYVLIHAFKDEEVRRYCIRNLRGDHFITYPEMPYRVLWNCVLDYVNSTNTFPDPATILVFVSGRLQQSHNGTTNAEEILRELTEFFDIVDSTEQSELNRRTALYLAKTIVGRALKEEIRVKIQRINGDDTAVGQIITDVYDKYLRASRYSSLSTEPFLPTDLRELHDQGRLIPYHLSFIDAMLGGGCRANEVYCLLGPTGGGKSILSLQIALSQAQYFFTENLPFINVYVTYELGYTETLLRATSQLTDIPKERLDAICGHREEITEEEQNRYNAAREIMLRNFRILDFSGTDPRTEGVTGTLEDVTEFLRKLQDDTGYRLGSVVLDWAGIIVEKEAMIKNVDIGKYRISELTSFVQRVKDIIAGPFQCATWVVHQLAGEVTSKPPHTLFHHSQAQWCKGFANNAAYAMCIGNTDPNYQVVPLSCTKSRRSRREPYRLLRLTDSLKFVDVSNSYVLDKSFGIFPRESDA